MRKNYFLIVCAILIGALGFNTAFAQSAMQVGRRTVGDKYNPMVSGIRNYKTFTTKPVDKSDEVVNANKGYENHPELGTLYANAPDADVYELIGERTEINKTFVKRGSNGTEIYKQTASAPIHYKDADGNWITIKAELHPDKSNPGVFAAYQQPAPVVIDVNNKFTSIGKGGNRIKYNNNLELVYEKSDGTQQSLGNANWSNYTAGDEGAYISNAWPGIDIELYVVRGAIKTNFLVMHALPMYADGKLLVRDHLQLETGMTLFANGKTTYQGNMEIRGATGEKIYDISAATVCEKGNPKTTFQMLDFIVNGSILDIAIPGNFFNRGESSYPVIIDPLVSLATNSVVNGSTYSSDWTVPCVYSNAATVPANITITDIQFAFTYTTTGGAWLMEGATDFRKAGCRSPTGPTGLAGFYWYCNVIGGGSCIGSGGAAYTIYADLAACIPPPQCPSYNLNLTMDFYQDYLPTAACATTYVYGSTPLTITVIGHTVEFVSTTASATTICPGASTTLTGTGTYGVPPYTFTWTPGPVMGSPVTVSPGTTTVYTLTITDACGITATGTRTKTVSTVAPITGTPTVCIGNTTALADATGGAHTWTSSNPGVASVNSATGVVTGVSAGTATITYTVTATGCTATMVVTVTPLPVGITGTTTLCVGATSTLADATAGGTWSSSNPGIASISATGVVTGVATGTATITYNLGGSCYVTALVTVSLLSSITGTPSVCVGLTTTLADATAGGTWSSSTPGVATISATGVVTGISAGTTTITYTSLTGCTTTMLVTVNGIAPITGTMNACVGGTSPLADAAGAGTWSTSSGAIATVSTTGVVTAVAAGTATITFTTGAGCTTTALFTVNDVAPISGTASICGGQIITLTDATPGGTWTSSSPGVATVGAGTGIVTGVSGGTTTITYTTAAGCTATFLVTVAAIAPITGTMNVCVGSTTLLATTSGAGTWSSSNTAVATVGATTGLVTGVAAGTVTITYTITSSGCSAIATVVVNGLPSISGTMQVCVGNTTALSSSIGGGTWSSSSAIVASIGATTGVVTGMSGSTATITYITAAGCSSNAPVTVNPLPAAIAGATDVCQGFTATLTDATTGGTWSSSNTAIAVVSPTGVVSGISGGTVTMTYTSNFGCTVTAPFTVNGTPPAITGTMSMCLGANTNLSDALAGGTWISGNTAIATVVSATGVVTGVATGVAPITYTSSFGCFITTTVTVNPLPSVVDGNTSICEGFTSILTNATPGGIWTSSDGTVATIAPTNGLATAVGAGTCTITYSVLGCTAFIPFTVNPTPPTITGLSTICVGATNTLTNGIPGGTWISSTPSVISIDASTGIVTGVANGNATITYTSLAGCVITGIDSVNAAPKFSFYMAPDICIGDTTKIELTSTSGSITGYTWDFGSAHMVSSSSNSNGPFYVSYPSAGTFSVTVTANTNVICPSLTIDDTIMVHNYPNAGIQAPIVVNGSTSICTSDSVLLRAADNDPNYSYFWEPIHFFNQNNIGNVFGKIELAGYVYLTVRDPFGCTSRDSIMIDAQPCCTVSMPDAFSPNNDGLNDVFRPVGLGTHGVHMFRIMNRWGQCVYESTNLKMAWDGNFNGVPQEIGVYYYYLAFDCDGKSVVEKGEVTLIR